MMMIMKVWMMVVMVLWVVLVAHHHHHLLLRHPFLLLVDVVTLFMAVTIESASSALVRLIFVFVIWSDKKHRLPMNKKFTCCSHLDSLVGCHINGNSIKPVQFISMWIIILRSLVGYDSI